jgi:peptide/nickel transport system permease protein
MLLRSVEIPFLKAGSFTPVALVIGVLSWMGVARLVRGITLELRQRDFIQAARVLGLPNGRIMLRHILPNVFSPIIVSATLGLAGAIISESGLSYLGFGVQLPTPTWGNMLSNTQNQITTAPWTVIFPGIAIFIVVIAINYIGDGLRDALDPRHFTK